jgi:uncharacterized protein
VSRALRVFRLLAGRGDSGAQRNLGYFFDEGIGVRPDQKRAIAWFLRAIKKGDDRAALEVAKLCIEDRRYSSSSKALFKASGNFRPRYGI